MIFSVLKESSVWRCGFARGVERDTYTFYTGDLLIYLCPCIGGSNQAHVLSRSGVMCINPDSRLELRLIERVR